jgi:nicotinate-nucleotide pyrophosphorylase (carboxylating)
MYFSAGTVDPNVMAVGSFLAKADGVVGGIHIAKLVFQMIDPELKAEFSHSDGDLVTNGTVFGTVQGRAHSLIQAERLSLNLMQRISGIATLTRAMVNECRGTTCKVLDTRKTVPGLRDIDKLAVRCGGGKSVYVFINLSYLSIDRSGWLTRHESSIWAP